jgi:hypothetical protein
MGELESVTEEAAEGLRRSIAVHADAEIHKRGADGTDVAPAARPAAPAQRRTTRASFERLR